MHKIFGTKEDKEYKDRIGAYIIPVKGNEVGVVETPKGYFLLGGGLDANETMAHKNRICRRVFINEESIAGN